MRKTIVAILLAVGCISLSVGCTDDDGESGNSGGATKVEDLSKVLANTMCSRVRDCCNESDQQEALGELGVDDIEECAPAATNLLDALLGEQLEMVEAGRSTFDGANFDKCMAAYRSNSCSEGVGLDAALEAAPECEHLFKGAVAEGGACADSSECADGICEGAEFDDDYEIVSEGTCVATGRDGDACEYYDECISGLYCVRPTYEEPGVCRRPKADGEACEHNEECGHDNCEDGVCVNETPEEFDGFCDGK